MRIEMENRTKQKKQRACVVCENSKFANEFKRQENLLLVNRDEMRHHSSSSLLREIFFSSEVIGSRLKYLKMMEIPTVRLKCRALLCKHMKTNYLVLTWKAKL